MLTVNFFMKNVRLDKKYDHQFHILTIIKIFNTKNENFVRKK